jgi:hypothetical protein
VVRPGEVLALPRFLEPPPACALQNLGPLVVSDHSLHLGEELALGRIAKGVVEKYPLHVELLKLLNEQPLIGIVAGEPIRGQDDHGVEFAAAGTVP